ncbi:MAG: SMC-Scp complex subunit ScpB [Bacteroidota bacterium]
MMDYQFVDGTRLSSVVEALIFASPDPIPADHLLAILTEGDEALSLESSMVERMIEQLNQRYEETGLSFRIVKVGGGFSFATRRRYHRWLSIFQHENAYRRLSQSAIEALAIVAYRQPVTKPEIDQIRGVDSGYIVRQLMEKELIKVSGRADSPGKPLLYRTTDQFLQHFGINHVEELPRPREIDEILKDDDMADHRKLLMERQMELDEEGAEQWMNLFLKRRTESDGEQGEIDERDRDNREGKEDETGATKKPATGASPPTGSAIDDGLENTPGRVGSEDSHKLHSDDGGEEAPSGERGDGSSGGPKETGEDGTSGESGRSGRGSSKTDRGTDV